MDLRSPKELPLCCDRLRRQQRAGLWELGKPHHRGLCRVEKVHKKRFQLHVLDQANGDFFGSPGNSEVDPRTCRNGEMKGWLR